MKVTPSRPYGLSSKYYSIRSAKTDHPTETRLGRQFQHYHSTYGCVPAKYALAMVSGSVSDLTDG